MIVVLGNCGTSLFAGFVIFPIIGFVATITNQKVKKVAASGTTLAFVVYPDALAQLPGFRPIWAVLFFFMLIILGIDSQVSCIKNYECTYVRVCLSLLRMCVRTPAGRVIRCTAD